MVTIIRSLMDRASCEVRADGGTTVTLIKNEHAHLHERRPARLSAASRASTPYQRRRVRDLEPA